MHASTVLRAWLPAQPESAPPTPHAQDDLEALPWRALPSAHMSVSPLNKLRFDLGPEESELLELRYARELSIDELAFVYGSTTARR